MQRRYLAIPCGLLFSIAAVAACTSFKASPIEGPEGNRDASELPDASPGPGSDIDGAARDTGAPPRCRLDQPFGTPVLVPTLNKAEHHSLSARPAGDFLYFVSDRHEPDLDFTKSDVYRARFQGDEFTDIEHLPVLSSTGEDVSATESGDGLALFLAVGDITTRRIKRSTRPDRGQPFGEPSPLPGGTILPDATQESDPYLVGKRLYFTSRGAAGADALIYAVNVEGNAPETATTKVVQVPLSGVLRHPVVNAAETELYFMRYTGGPPTLFLARRDSLGAPFNEPISQPKLDIVGSTNVNVTGLSADECDLYLAAKLGDDAPFDIYRARRGAP